LMPQLIPEAVVRRTIEENAPAGTVESNLKAFRTGWEAVKNSQPEPRDEIAREFDLDVKIRDTY
jgi:Pyruvate/2-oxoacid:ferredoxin oxidoreductase gamma subunit